MLDSEMIRNGGLDSMLQVGRIYRKKINMYFVVICFMFVSVMIIGLNYYRTYKVQDVLRHELTDIMSELQDKEAVNRSLSQKVSMLEVENEGLKSLNDELQKQWSDNEVMMQGIQLQNIELINENQKLTKKNSDLADDNIKLQSTLKIAASVGIKPQNYTLFEGVPPKSVVDDGEYVGKFLGTAYTPSVQDCGNNKGITNSGLPIVPGVSIAVDKKFWPFGTVFYIKGLGYTVAMDIGSAIKGKYRFDFAVFDQDFADKFGLRKWEVYLVKMGNGTVGDIVF